MGPRCRGNNDPRATRASHRLPRKVLLRLGSAPAAGARWACVGTRVDLARPGAVSRRARVFPDVPLRVSHASERDDKRTGEEVVSTAVAFPIDHWYDPFAEEQFVRSQFDHPRSLSGYERLGWAL